MIQEPEGAAQPDQWTVDYSFPARSEHQQPFLAAWGAAQHLDIGARVPPSHPLRSAGRLLYPTILDHDAPFGLAAASGGEDAAADGLSYALVGNRSAYVYFVVGQKLIARIPVAFFRS